MSSAPDGGPKEAHVTPADAYARARNVRGVEVERIGGARVPHEHGHSLDVLPVRQVQGGERVAQGVGAHPLEAGVLREPEPVAVPG